MSASCASKRLSARTADTQTSSRRAGSARALRDPLRPPDLGCLPADSPPMRGARQLRRRLTGREAAALRLQLSRLWDTTVLSLRSVQRQEIATARPAVGVDAMLTTRAPRYSKGPGVA